MLPLLLLATLSHPTRLRGLSSPSSTASRLRALCSLARVGSRLHTLQDELSSSPSHHELSELSTTLVRDSLALARSVRSLPHSGALPADPKALDDLNREAAALHATIVKQEREIEILDEEGSLTSSSERAREMFAMLDSNADGRISLEEFVERATLLTPVPQERLRSELEERFVVSDLNKDGSLDFDEFARMLSTLSRDALGPLRSERAQALARLLSVTLEMTSLTLARELERAATRDFQRGTLTPPVRVDKLERCVDRWCAIGERAEILALAAAEAGKDGGAAALAVGAAATPVPSEPSDAAARTAAGTVVEPLVSSTPAAQAHELEALLEQVGDLAADLSMTNVTGSAMWSIQKMGSQALRQADAALRFCWRGLRIFAGDVVESVCLLARVLRGGKLTTSDVRTIKRTATDAIALIPYTIIMVIPLSPPGHVFAFSLLNRCFPSAVPSAFTMQRQDIDEIYSRIASEAAGAEATERERAFKLLGGWGGRTARKIGSRTKGGLRALGRRIRGAPSGA